MALNTRKQCQKCNTPISGDFDLCRSCYYAYTRNTRKNKTTDYQDIVNIHTPPEVRKKLNMGDIWDNSVKCLDCGDIIRSRNLHDYRHCSCGKSSVDGGSWYCKTSGNVEVLCVPFTYPSKEDDTDV